MTRIQQNWPEHDKVVEASANTWRQNSNQVAHTNPDGFKRFSVGETSFPDVVITDIQNRLLAVEEVETEDTLTEEGLDQWKEYSSFNVPLNLIVPAEKVLDAQTLISGIVNIKIQGYVIESGNVRFV